MLFGLSFRSERQLMKTRFGTADRHIPNISPSARIDVEQVWVPRDIQQSQCSAIFRAPTNLNKRHMTNCDPITASHTPIAKLLEKSQQQTAIPKMNGVKESCKVVTINQFNVFRSGSALLHSKVDMCFTTWCVLFGCLVCGSDMNESQESKTHWWNIWLEREREDFLNTIVMMTTRLEDAKAKRKKKFERKQLR